MAESKMKEFIHLYYESQKNSGTSLSKEDVFLEIVKQYLDAATKRDKKRTAKMILKAKPFMGSNPLWDFVDEDELKQLINS